jgi:hypothetical protein
MSLMSKGSRGTCIPLGISTFLLTASQHTRTLKHLLATGACQVQSEDAYYGHLILRLMGYFVLFLHLTGGVQRPADDGGDHL